MANGQTEETLSGIRKYAHSLANRHICSSCAIDEWEQAQIYAGHTIGAKILEMLGPETRA